MSDLRQLAVQSYLLEDDSPDVCHGNPATLERRRQRDGRVLWAVCKMGRVLNQAGEWEWEPQPSSRDDDFIQRARFANPDAALRLYDKHKDEWR